MRGKILTLARKLCETEDIEEAQNIAGELQRAIRQHFEDLGTTLYSRRMGARGEVHATKVVEMPQKTKI